MDNVYPFDTAPKECRSAITLTDYQSKCPEVCFNFTMTSSKCIEFCKQIFSRKISPNEVITDYSIQFMSHELESILGEREIRLGHSSIHYSQGNGVIERLNPVLKITFQDMIDPGKFWKFHVSGFLAVKKATSHATSGLSPSLSLHQ